MLFQFADLQVEQEANDHISEYIRDRIRDTVKDQQTAQDLLPTDYPYGTKRPCIDTNYYETFNRDNVSLVNLRRTPIETITDRGIKTMEGEREFDAIVYATGFDAMTGPLLRVDIRGRVVSNFRMLGLMDRAPTLASQYTDSLTCSRLPAIEPIGAQQYAGIHRAACRLGERRIQWMREEGKATIEPSDSAEREWAEHTEQLANMTLYPRRIAGTWGQTCPENLACSSLTWAESDLPTHMRPGCGSGTTVLKRLSREERKLTTRLRPGFSVPSITQPTVRVPYGNLDRR